MRREGRAHQLNDAGGSLFTQATIAETLRANQRRSSRENDRRLVRLRSLRYFQAPNRDWGIFL